jgi:hypothetical protein
MRLLKLSAAVSVMLTLAVVPVFAGQRGNSANRGPKTTSTTTHGPTKTTRGPSAKAPSAKGPSAKATTTKVAKADAKLAKADTKLAKVDAKAAKKTGSTTATASSLTDTGSTSTTPTTGTTTTPTTIDFTGAPVGQKLSTNGGLRSKLESRLTGLGYTGTAYQAAYGFKNLGQFVAATNVSRNLGLSFEQLKIQMTGLSVNPDGTVLRANVGADGLVTMVDPSLVTNAAPVKSLGQSIQTVKSGVNATTAAQTATTQANAEIQATTAVK